MDALRATDSIADRARAAAVTSSGVDRDRPPLTDRYQVVLERKPGQVRGQSNLQPDV